MVKRQSLLVSGFSYIYVQCDGGWKFILKLENVGVRKCGFERLSCGQRPVPGTDPSCRPQVLDDCFYPGHHLSPHRLLFWAWGHEIEEVYDFFMQTGKKGHSMDTGRSC